MTLIALHILHNHAPSNLNRDENGNPKDSLFGGYRRARISSQALKRSYRMSDIFEEAFGPIKTSELRAFRTQRLPELVQKRLSAYKLDKEAEAAIIHAASKLGKADKGNRGGKSDTSDSDDDGSDDDQPKAKQRKQQSSVPVEPSLDTKQLMFLTHAEIDRLASELVTRYTENPAGFNKIKWDTFRDKKEEKYVPHSVDIALFGRMTTSSPFKDIDAAVQVAHALSTHTIEQEFDYYTALDEISGKVGAGFIGDTAFNSATYYEYLNIHWEGLVDNLGGEEEELAMRVVKALITAALTVNPTGMQNRFASHTRPAFALLEVLPKNQPFSYANAFLDPVPFRGEKQLLNASLEALLEHIDEVSRMYELDVQRAYFCSNKLDAGKLRNSYALDQNADRQSDRHISDATFCPSITPLLIWMQTQFLQTEA